MITAIKGAPIKVGLLENLTKILSLVNSLAASAKGCGNPKIPTLLGPLRSWIHDNTLRSIRVKNPTPKANTTNMIITFIKAIYRIKFSFISTPSVDGNK